MDDSALTPYGLALRDTFAAAALTGILADHAADGSEDQWAYIADEAYSAADAMLAARQLKKKA